MKLHNTLTRSVEEFKPLDATEVRMYSCGPTVYDQIHIGNLSSFIYADTLRRSLKAQSLNVRHVMNITDVDDKTIKASKAKFPEEDAKEALSKLTNEYSDLFMADMEAIGNNIGATEFIYATKSIEAMRRLIAELHEDGFAYIADDGVYFSIEKYRASGKKYGQLTEITDANTSNARIANDEYDKDSVHDFVLWKTAKPGEPSWEFELDGKDMQGRPGWHIECSAMSVSKLGQPFDIHTGGVDLIFPHHENEIAQSTGGKGSIYAQFFFHNEHLLVKGKKMSKSLNNFYALQDIRDKGYDPLAFRLMVLQSHYRSQSSFTWETLEAAQNRLNNYRRMADLRYQTIDDDTAANYEDLDKYRDNILASLFDDLNTPQALAHLSKLEEIITTQLFATDELDAFNKFLEDMDAVLGLGLLDSTDITDEQKQLISDRQQAREAKDWPKSDEIRDELHAHGLTINDTDHGPIWSRS